MYYLVIIGVAHPARDLVLDCALSGEVAVLVSQTGTEYMGYNSGTGWDVSGTVEPLNDPRCQRPYYRCVDIPEHIYTTAKPRMTSDGVSSTGGALGRDLPESDAWLNDPISELGPIIYRYGTDCRTLYGAVDEEVDLEKSV